MKNNRLAKGLMIVAVISLVGFGAHAFAADTTATGTTLPMTGKMGYHGKGGAQGNCPMVGNRDGNRNLNQNLTPEELEKFEAERTAFRESTKDLKRDIYQKHLELQAEMAKKAPDKKTATAIQKQISELKAQLDTKQLEHRFNLKAINPDLGTGMGKFHHRGQSGKGRMGNGNFGKRPCQM